MIPGKTYLAEAVCLLFVGLPAERDVDSHLVDLSLVGQAVAVVGEKVHSFIVRVHGVAEALIGSVNADKSLWYIKQNRQQQQQQQQNERLSYCVYPTPVLMFVSGDTYLVRVFGGFPRDEQASSDRVHTAFMCGGRCWRLTKRTASYSIKSSW